jgi:hypothetical protein
MEQCGETRSRWMDPMEEMMALQRMDPETEKEEKETEITGSRKWAGVGWKQGNEDGRGVAKGRARKRKEKLETGGGGDDDDDDDDGLKCRWW